MNSIINILALVLIAAITASGNEDPNGNGKYRPEWNSGRYRPVGDSGRYVPDFSGKYKHIDVRYMHQASNVVPYTHQGSNSPPYIHSSDAGKYVHDGSGLYRGGNGDKSGKYTHHGNTGKYVRSDEGKYSENPEKWRYVHVDDMRELGKYIHIHIPYNGGYGPYSPEHWPYIHFEPKFAESNPIGAYSCIRMDDHKQFNFVRDGADIPTSEFNGTIAAFDHLQSAESKTNSTALPELVLLTKKNDDQQDYDPFRRTSFSDEKPAVRLQYGFPNHNGAAAKYFANRIDDQPADNSIRIDLRTTDDGQAQGDETHRHIPRDTQSVEKLKSESDDTVPSSAAVEAETAELVTVETELDTKSS